ncbi:hypothetical protein [Lichenifustis flavocetrariae]|uniref:Twin-arginine translocation signal domain-containing protein n=1 Tax=Lichenifustis flavocetrariae TaxID=2949735 RepID=A0AA42CQ67_9HYPH|nr:hypothetical protein [Lichenifustis flavocetrariae]MCW6511147.1 hypothetical protein [Lichenifustis flavocetrariae]
MPTRPSLSRRRFLAGATLAAAGLPLRAWAQETAPSAPVRFSAVRVDAGPLAARGGGMSAAMIQRVLPGKMKEIFADLLVPASHQAPLLVARIDTLYLSGYADAISPGAALQSLDSMDGAGLVVMGRQVQASTRLHVTLPASYSGAYYLPDIDARRIDSLCTQFAYWLRREMQL